MTDWIITVPKTVKWEDYERELEAVADGYSDMHFKIPHIPKDARVSDRCFIVWNGKVRGWMRVSDWIHLDRNWKCEVTGVDWGPGNYVMRSGPFHEVDGPEMRGFRGIRKMKEQKDE